MMQINTNLLGINSYRNVQNAGTRTQKASEKLSTGLKTNKSVDDAAGLAISEKMRSQIQGLDKAERNVEDGISLIQTAEGGMSTINDMVIRQRELTIQALNDTNTDEDKAKIQSEINELSKEITSTAERTQFNTIQLLSCGSGTGGGESITIHIQNGANAEQNVFIDRYDCRATALGVEPLVIDPLEEAEKSLTKLDAAIVMINDYRTNAGAQQNRLEYTSKYLSNTALNVSDAKSRITDADMAKEMMELAKGNILQQAGMAMLSQANQTPQRVLDILR